VRVVLDGQVTGADGIARVTRHLASALARLAPEAGIELVVLPPVGVPRYTRAEGDHLMAAARRHGADLLHLLDYRVPLNSEDLPVVATVHDLLRVRHPQYCYTDQEFSGRFGPGPLWRLEAVTRTLRDLAEYPSGVVRPPQSWHEEFVARMIAHVAATAAMTITPSRTVAAHLQEAVQRPVSTAVAAWGADHLSPVAPGDLPPDLTAGRYLLYVGQARAHKGLADMFAAYRTVAEGHPELPLVLVGRDFTPDFPDSGELPPGVVVMGEVDDLTLAQLYANAAVLVHMSAHEGFGLTPLEAMACGTRVLVSDLPVLRETLGRHASYTDPTDSATTARVLGLLLTEPDLHRQARADWAARYRWDTCASVVIDAYRKALL
jgi:glycosyltransferase involved in cell wall biosynthesis